MKKILLVMVMALFALSCGGNSGTGAAGGKKGKTLTIDLAAEPESIDPQLSTDINGGTVNDLTSEGLIRKGKDGKLEPGLAEKWEVSEDKLKWTFHIKEGLKWSNGDPITAQDFKDGWVRALDPKTASQYARMIFPVKNAEEFNSGKAKAEDLGIKVIDDKTLEVTLHSPLAYFEDIVTFKTYMPLEEKFYKETGDKYFTDADKTLSSGPYILKEWVRGSEMILEKNPNYWDAANVKVDKVVLKFTKDSGASLNAFKNEEVDVVEVTVDQAKEFKDDPRLVLSNDGSVWYFLFNTKIKALSNAKIRKAFVMAVNRDELVNKVLDGRGKVAKTLVPTEIGIKGLSKDFPEEVPTSIPGFNPEEAKKLLAEGLKELGMDKLPELEMIFNDNGNNKLIVVYLQESLRKNLGVELKLSAMTFPERIERMKQKNFDIVYAGWSGDFHDPITYLDLFTTKGGNNYGEFSNARYDELVKIANSSGDQAVRMPALVEIEKIISEEMPVGVLYHRKKSYLVAPKVKGLGFTAIGGEYYFGDLDIEN